jgi:RNA-directed DNA polymerase
VVARHRKEALSDTNFPDFCKQVRLTKSLWKAWRHVFRASLKSASEQNREAAWEFDAHAAARINRIQRQLQEGRFKFAPARGIPKRREGKSPRPIVDAPLRNKIVQRSILSVVQDIPTVKSAIRNPASFGGLEGRSVRHAMEAIVGAVNAGAQIYARSDIQDFFSNIPKSDVEKALHQLIDDGAFVDLIMRALEVELENLQELGANKQFFPLHEIGVAQGCCLSPFIGNVLLRDFDRQMNCRGIVCFRYVDDFVILGPDSRSTRRAFSSAQKTLEKLGLTVYDPFADSDKAKMGPVESGFEFLGCRIRPGMISPSKAAKHRLLGKV